MNNAGTTKVIPHNDLEAANVDVWREIFEVNLFGTWELSVAAMPALKERRGSIVNVTSIAGRAANRLIHSLRHLEGCLESLDGVAREGRCPDVRVNAVAPGLIDTEWTKDWDAIRGFVQAVAPLRRSGTPRRRRGCNRRSRHHALRDRSGGPRRRGIGRLLPEPSASFGSQRRFQFWEASATMKSCLPCKPLHSSVESETETNVSVITERPWNVIVWNDPVTPMTVVVIVFKKIFGYSNNKCTQLMLAVHHEGRANVWSGQCERAESYCVKLQVAGLQATVERDA